MGERIGLMRKPNEMGIMRKTVVIILLIFIQNLAGMPLHAATNNNDFGGTYTGKLEKITMNGKSFKGLDHVTFTLNRLENGNYKMTSSPIGPIGKMPGEVNISLEIQIDKDGNMTAPKNVEAGNIKKGILHLSITQESLSGHIKNKQMTFALDCYSMKLFGYKAVKAQVGFNGKKN